MSEERPEYNPNDHLMSLKGKEYLPVAQRIVWFRRDYPEGVIETKLIELDREKGFALYHARVETGKGGEAGASGSETAKDFGDYIEKAETKAVGRALGYLGYGTASAGFEEGPRVVDAPQSPRNRPAPQKPAQQAREAPAPTWSKDEFVAFIEGEMRRRREGTPYEQIVTAFGAARPHMTADQYEDAKEYLRNIRLWKAEKESK